MSRQVHDPYVFKDKGVWWWKCDCGANNGPFTLRRDADDSDSSHREMVRRQSDDELRLCEQCGVLDCYHQASGL